MRKIGHVLATALALGCGLEPEAPGDDHGDASADGTGTRGDTDATESDDHGGDDQGGGDADESASADDSAGSGGGSGNSSDSNGDSDDAGDGDGSGGIVCEEHLESHILEVTPPSAVLVLDKSGSMSWDWDHDDNDNTPPITRWHSLYNVVGAIVASFAESVDLGAQLFPSYDAPGSLPGACEIDEDSPEVEVAPDNGAAILAGIPGPDDDVQGGTPATPGVASAVEHLLTLDPESPKAVILVTDGAPNCKDGVENSDKFQVADDNLPVVVGEAFSQDGVPTYVVGIGIVDQVINIPQINPHDMLNEVAEAGGVPKGGDEKFYNVDNEMELEQALDTITGFIECTIQLDSIPELPDNVSVTVNGQGVPHIDDCNNESGWRYLTDMGPYDSIVLCGDACSTNEPLTEVDVVFECP